MSTNFGSAGFIYVLTNPSMPGLVKIGKTASLSEDRADKLFTTGVPTPFKVEFRALTSMPAAVEMAAHKLLSKYRTNPRREFFTVDAEGAVDAVRNALVQAGGIESWKSLGIHRLSAGNRLSLSLEAGQIFAVVGFKTFFDLSAKKAGCIDLWQSHSDSDQLEILVVDSPTYVAGFSDGDCEGINDPVPWLDRINAVANGMLIGRERLMPGERLVWIPKPESQASSSRVIFEVRDHCQIVSRTWSPVFGPHGFPSLLNDFSHEQVWPSAEKAIVEAIAMPVPRTWAPRENRPPNWALIGAESQSPEFWLPQLKARAKKSKSRAKRRAD